MRRFKLTDFTYNESQLSADASDLQMPPGMALRNFEIKSDHTGVVVPFEFKRVERDDNMDVLYWTYESVGEFPTVFTATIFND